MIREYATYYGPQIRLMWVHQARATRPGRESRCDGALLIEDGAGYPVLYVNNLLIDRYGTMRLAVSTAAPRFVVVDSVAVGAPLSTQLFLDRMLPRFEELRRRPLELRGRRVTL